jgi:L-rhamnose mutarotase
MMRRFGQTIILKPECREEYVRRHKAVWPGVLIMIKECGLRNYSIFLKDNTLFAYFEYEGDNFVADMQRMEQHEETQRWWDVVKPLMEPIESKEPGEFWADMEEIFHID